MESDILLEYVAQQVVRLECLSPEVTHPLPSHCVNVLQDARRELQVLEPAERLDMLMLMDENNRSVHAAASPV